MQSRFFHVKKADRVILQQHWERLATLFLSDTEVTSAQFRILEMKYSEANRQYHNLHHILTLLTLSETLRHRMLNVPGVLFAIWFHDVIYNSQRNDNEEASVRLMEAFLQALGAGEALIELVRDLILATKSHQGADLSDDAKIFLDLDLSILGAPRDIYRKYSQAIRIEYEWVDEPAFREGRQKVLRTFLERDQIYFTDEVRSRLEAKARKNIADELQSL